MTNGGVSGGGEAVDGAEVGAHKEPMVAPGETENAPVDFSIPDHFSALGLESAHAAFASGDQMIPDEDEIQGIVARHFPEFALSHLPGVFIDVSA